MKFIVTPIDTSAGEAKGPPIITHCVLCSEDPRFCPPLF